MKDEKAVFFRQEKRPIICKKREAEECCNVLSVSCLWIPWPFPWGTGVGSDCHCQSEPLPSAVSKTWVYTLSGFKKALLQNPREMIRGRIFSEMIRIQARKSELQAKSRSYGPKVGDTAGQTPRFRAESSRKEPRMGFRCFCRKPPLKPS